MHLLCPHCQHPITVPDSSAGQTVDCPLCGKSFPAPALSLYAPPTATTTTERPHDPDDDREPYGVVPPRANRAAFPTSDPPRPQAVPSAPPQTERVEPPAAPSPGLAPEHHGFSVRLNLPIVRASIVVLLALALILTFFPWSGSYPGGYGVYTQTPWRALVGSVFVDSVGDAVLNQGDKLKEITPSNLLMLPYLLLLIAVCVLVAAEFVLPHLNQPLPPQLLRLRPESHALRHAIEAGLIGLATLLLLVQISMVGFGVERAVGQIVDENPDLKAMIDAKTPEKQDQLEIKRGQLLGQYQLMRTVWLKLAVLVHILALLGLAAEYWLESRGDRPEPRFLGVW